MGWSSARATPVNGSPTWSRVERERTGIKISEGGLQQGLRLLHRSDPCERRDGAGRIYPQANPGQRRALHHAGDERIRDAGAECRRAHPRDRRAPVPRGVCQPGCISRSACWLHCPGDWRSWMCWPPWRKLPPSAGMSARRWSRRMFWKSTKGAIRWSSRSLSGRALCAQ